MKTHIPFIISAVLILSLICFSGCHDHPSTTTSIPQDSDSTTADTIISLRLPQEHYTNIYHVVQELYTLYQICDAATYCPNTAIELSSLGYESIFYNRLLFHLQDTTTFNNDIDFDRWGMSSIPFRTFSSPDKKIKFYTYVPRSMGSMWMPDKFIQYKDNHDSIIAHEWQNNLRWDGRTSPDTVWQFNYHDTTYYIVRSYFRTGPERTLSVEIISLENGKIKFHTHFFPEDFEPSLVCVLTNPDGSDYEWREEGTYWILAYSNRWHPIGLSFDPETLTLTAQTEDNNGNPITKRHRLRVK